MDLEVYRANRDNVFKANYELCQNRGIRLISGNKITLGVIVQLHWWSVDRVAYDVYTESGIKHPYVNCDTIDVIAPNVDLLTDDSIKLIPCKVCRWAYEPSMALLNGTMLMKCPLCSHEVTV